MLILLSTVDSNVNLALLLIAMFIYLSSADSKFNLLSIAESNFKCVIYC